MLWLTITFPLIECYLKIIRRGGYYNDASTQKYLKINYLPKITYPRDLFNGYGFKQKKIVN